MRFEELPKWAREEVVADMQRVFPELHNSKSLKSYIEDKEDFELVDESEDGEEPDRKVYW